jgi:hypothetical protein
MFSGSFRFFAMKHRYEKTKIVLVLALFLSIPAYFTFTYYYSLSEADFLSEQLKLESVDQIELLTGVQEKSKALGPINFHHLFFLDTGIFEFFLVLSHQTFSIDPTTLILRC